MTDRLDIILFGATGFTGKYTLLQIYKLATTKGRNLTWGIAGRSRDKLKNSLSETSKKIGVINDLSFVPIIIADCNDEESIKKMTAQAKIIINCCGPYTIYGEVVVKSCIETTTHYVDVCIEPLFIEGIEFKYREVAEEKGVYIVNACGGLSVFVDMGLVFLEKNFKGTLNSVETYAQMTYENGVKSGTIMHYTTWESFVFFLKNITQLSALKKKFNSKPLPTLEPKISFKFPFRTESKDWAIAYFILDRDIMIRSQRYFYEHEGKRPVQLYCYGFANSYIVLMAALLFPFVAILSQFKFGRHLLLTYPKFFSAGVVSHEPPSEENLEFHRGTYTLEGLGWSEKLAEGDDKYKTKPNKAIVGRVTSVNPGYGFTAHALTLCAIVTITEKENLPVKGGVYTTAAAFSKTSLIEQLQENGVNFEIISIKDL